MLEVIHIVATRPAFAMLAIVAKMFSVWAGVLIEIIVGRLQEAGYRVWFRRPNALTLGLAQDRCALWLCVVLGIEVVLDLGWPIPIDPVPLEDLLPLVSRDFSKYPRNRPTAPKAVSIVHGACAVVGLNT